MPGVREDPSRACPRLTGAVLAQTTHSRVDDAFLREFCGDGPPVREPTGGPQKRTRVSFCERRAVSTVGPIALLRTGPGVR